MMYLNIKKHITFLIMLICFSSFSQENFPKLSVYLDCGNCDHTYIQQELKHINFLRDQKHADIHILVRTQVTGNSGTEYNLEFFGQKDFKSIYNKFSFSTYSINTNNENRDLMVRNINIGLSIFWNKLYEKNPELFKMNKDSISEETVKIESKTKDLWNKWVFNIGINGSLNGQETSKYSRGGVNISAKQVTKENKFYVRALYDFSKSVFTYGDTEITSRENSTDFIVSDAISINDHWSVGGFFNTGNSTFKNYSFFASLKPAIEYSYFTYEESLKKQITVSYKVGGVNNNYVERTIFNKEKEFLWEHNLSLGGSVQQKWGSLSGEIEYSSYLHDTSFHAYNFYLGTNFRIASGLSFNMNGNYSITNNQMNLAGGDLALEELLLRQQEVKSGYNFFVSMGINYSFGSIFSSIVNPRFDF